jgi:Ca2+-transporting ATPase
MVLGDWIEAGAILAIVILNAFVGAIQESRAEQALQSLKKMAAPEAQVLRDGVRKTIPARELVPGDIVLLEAGSIVPADLRLIEAAQLRVDESSLTGESVPVDKDADAVLPEDTALADRVNMAFMGTTVAYGRGVGVVVATGPATVLGEIAGVIEEPQEETPLQRKLEEVGKVLGVLILIICGLVFVVEILRDPNLHILLDEGLLAYLRTAERALLGFFIIAVSLAVAAVPEGLPAVVTLCLAAGMREMLRRNALVRRLPSVETLGSATVICADKTGTLTQNQMTVTTIWVWDERISVTGQGYRPEGQFLLDGRPLDPKAHPLLLGALWIGLLCNDAELREENGAFRVIGDPTEGALVVAGLKAGLSKNAIPRVSELPFDSERKRMTTIHPGGEFSPRGFRALCGGGKGRPGCGSCSLYGVGERLRPHRPYPGEAGEDRGDEREPCLPRAPRFGCGVSAPSWGSRGTHTRGDRAGFGVSWAFGDAGSSPAGGSRGPGQGPPRGIAHDHDHRGPCRHRRGHRQTDRPSSAQWPGDKRKRARSYE